MRQSEILLSGIRSVLSHKLRSFLTLAGIIIGVAAVTIIFSSVAAMKTLVNDMISSLGYDNVIMIYSSFKNDDKDLKYPRVKRFRYLNYDDYLALKKGLDNVEIIYPYVQMNTNTVINNQKKRIRLFGIGKEFFPQKSYEIKYGRNFNNLEEEEGKNVCVIGATLRENYFPNEDPLDKYISFGNVRAKIVGVMKQSEFSENFRMNRWEKMRDQQSCFVPAKFAVKYFRPNMRVDQIVLKAGKYSNVGLMYNKARQIILARHKMADDIEIQDISQKILEFRTNMNDFLKNWNIILVAIASVSLLTGGLGLFSILLISIRERMTEIGIRKSMGAKNIDIFAHFIYESVSLSLFGGLVGAGISIFVVKILAAKLAISVGFPVLGLIVGLLFALSVGVLSGFYPSYKASKIDPVRAIFYYT